MRSTGKALLAAIVFAAASLAPFAASATPIDFATLPGANGDNFTTYTENGFNVTTSAGQFFVGQVYGDPVPDIFGTNTPATSAITLTRVGGGDFTLDQFALSSNEGATRYTLTGFLGGSEVFFDKNMSVVQDVFAPIAPQATFVVDSVTLQFESFGSTSYNVDNIDVTPIATPEPGSIVLLGSGMLGLIAVVRRRLLI